MSAPVQVRVTAPYWRLARTAATTVWLEIEEAALDHCGVRDIRTPLLDVFWFPTHTHADAFTRRLRREVPEVSSLVLGRPS